MRPGTSGSLGVAQNRVHDRRRKTQRRFEEPRLPQQEILARVPTAFHGSRGMTLAKNSYSPVKFNLPSVDVDCAWRGPTSALSGPSMCQALHGLCPLFVHNNASSGLQCPEPGSSA